MPKNHFVDRPEESKIPDKIKIGDIVLIVTKEKQGTMSKDDLIKGEVVSVLSHGKYYKNGVKVRILKSEFIGHEEKILPQKEKKIINIEDRYVVGRVQYIIQEDENSKEKELTPEEEQHRKEIKRRLFGK